MRELTRIYKIISILAVGMILYKSFCAAFLEKRVFPFEKLIPLQLPHLTGAFDDIFNGSKLSKSHGASCMKLLS